MLCFRIDVVLQLLDFVKNADKFFAKRRDHVFNPWWDLWIGNPFNNAKFDVLSKTTVEHLGRKPVDTSYHFAGPVDPVRKQLVHRQRPFTTVDGLNHARTLLVRGYSRNFFPLVFH